MRLHMSALHIAEASFFPAEISISFRIETFQKLDMIDSLSLQVAELQSKIDGLYRSAFAEVEVEVSALKPGNGRAVEQPSSRESFPDLSEATFGLLGRQRPHALKVRHATHGDVQQQSKWGACAQGYLILKRSVFLLGV